MTTALVHPMPGYALNRTRQVFLATELRFADRFLSRLRGLLTTQRKEFGFGRGLWIQPSKGVHCIGMRYPIDAVYLDANHRVIHIHSGLRPWRLGAIRPSAAGVLELPAGSVARTHTQIGDEVLIHAEPCLGPIAR
ncbi:MAG TPA: DUF192 domain-containing protein [Terriglobales bacterium]|nr:DUF192 domain-containing protein [Terriglobales bacterium]